MFIEQTKLLYKGITEFGTFAKDMVREDYRSFFTTYPSMIAQATTAAHNDWAKLVSEIPNMLHVGSTPELKPSCCCLLIALNHIFDLKIDSFEQFRTTSISLAADAGKKNQNRINELLPLINTGLKDRLKISEENPDPIKFTDNPTDVKGTKSSLEISSLAVKLSGYIRPNAHAEINTANRIIAITLSTGQATPFHALELAVNGCLASGEENGALKYLADTNANDLTTRIQLCHHNNQILLMLLHAVLSQSDRNAALDDLQAFAALEKCSTTLIHAARAGIDDPEASICISAMNLFSELVKHKQAFDEATAAARAGMAHSNKYIRSSALKLFSELVKHGKGHKAIDEILNNDTTPDDIRESLRSLLREYPA